MLGSCSFDGGLGYGKSEIRWSVSLGRAFVILLRSSKKLDVDFLVAKGGRPDRFVSALGNRL